MTDYIVRRVDEILRAEFGLALGLADTTTWGERIARQPGLTLPPRARPEEPFVQILDPATGTGNFLVAVIDRIHRTMDTVWQAQDLPALERTRLWNDYVPRHLLPRLHGFELTPTPFAVAHLNIEHKLRETGYRFGSSECIRVYLTNSLEPPRTGTFGAREAQLADRFKAEGVPTVILGNPPYAAISANLTPACRAVVDAYRQVAGQPIRERGMLQFEKNLQDDYVKFLAHAEQAILRAGAGVVGFITNHSFLDGPTLRGLRWSLAHSFNRISVLDLHGGANKQERPPDGGADENVFAIRQGVAISLLRRTRPLNAALAQVERGDLWGTHTQKFQALNAGTDSAIPMQPVTLAKPHFFFVADTAAADAVWEAAVPLTAAFVKFSTGTETGFDELLLDFERPALLRKIRTFADPGLTAARLRQHYGIDGGHAELLLARRHTFDVAAARHYCRQLQFRPFDYRFAYLKKALLKTNSFNVMTELSVAHPGLVATRQTKERFGVFVTPGFCGHKCTSAYDRSYVCASALGGDRTAAMTSHFLRRACAAARVDVSAKVLFHYLYAILSAPAYRTRFGCRLCREFPRIPLTTRPVLLTALASLGARLVALHLLQDELGPPRPLAGTGTPRILPGYPRYEAGRVLINSQRWFEGVPSTIWDSHIGGFRVCEKWLKDRRGRLLARADVAHYQKILSVLARTQHLTAEIDAAIVAHGGWTNAFG
jgi:predicted helicase